MSPLLPTIVRRFALLLPLLTAACETDDKTQPAVSQADDDDERADAAVTEENPAILIAAFVRNPEGRNIYVGAVPEVPSGKLDYSQFIEFDSVDVYTANGFVYVWERETASMTQYSVKEDLSLQKGPVLGFSNFGLGSEGGSVPAFANAHLAYVLSPLLDVIIKYDPTSMELLGTIDVTRPDRGDMDIYAVDYYRFGDAIVWLLSSENSETQQIHRGVTALLLQDDSDEVKLLEDDRCVGGDGGHVDDKGNLYIRANATWGIFAAYGDDAESIRTCTLRINKGETEFDNEYLLDHKELTGSYVNGPWFHIEGSKYIANAWPADRPFPENRDDFWGAVGYEPLLVDIEEKTAEPYPDLADRVVVSSIEFKVDGVPYYQMSDTGTSVNARSEIVELRTSGITKRFELPELWAFGRIR